MNRSLRLNDSMPIRAANAVPMPSIPEMAAVWTYWGVTEANIISGKQKPAAGWQKMIADIQSKIKK